MGHPSVPRSADSQTADELGDAISRRVAQLSSNCPVESERNDGPPAGEFFRLGVFINSNLGL